MADSVDIFQFMVVRAPEVPAPAAARRNLIRDDVLGPAGRVERDLFSASSTSAFGQLIYQIVFCSDDLPGFTTDFEYVLEQLLPSLTQVNTPCALAEEPAHLRAITQMADRETFFHDGVHYVVPNRLDDLPEGVLPTFFLDMMRAVDKALDDTPGSGKRPWTEQLLTALRAIRDDTPLYATVFMPTGGTAAWLNDAKAALFDALYRLYILRRRVPTSLDEVIRALQMLHTLEALAVDELLARALQRARLSPEEHSMLQSLKGDYPDLRSFRPLPPSFPLIRGRVDMATYLAALPVIHPLFAKLHGLRKPFNPIRRIGCGDLKVVKQWLIGYQVGEIAHVENVLLGENRSRVHRHLEKSEDVFTTTRDETTETQEDSQTTDRYELKRETDNVLNTSLNVNANLDLNVTYNNSAGGYTIVTSAGGGFAYNRAQTDQVKTTANFAREVVDRAVKRIETRVSSQRTTTKLFETEETTTHGFNNVPGKRHISGIYRWLDKRYRAQVFNYGKRMMFEFLVPEPAAFLVESRMRALEATIELPRIPNRPELATIPNDINDLTVDDIDVSKYEELSRTYDLSDLTPPVFERSIDLVDSGTGNPRFKETGLAKGAWEARPFRCLGGLKGYRVTRLRIMGEMYFGGADEVNAEPRDQNTFQIRANGQILYEVVREDIERWFFGFGGVPNNMGGDVAVANAQPFETDDLLVIFSFFDIDWYSISVQADLELDDAVADNWRLAVLKRVVGVEKRRVDEINQQREQSYQSDLATYRARRDELQATAVNDLLRSRSEASNRQVILRELKRQVIAMITRELTTDPADDRFSYVDAIGSRTVSSEFFQFEVTETPAGAPTSVSASFAELKIQSDFPVPNLSNARRKGRHVQFLEQAFEWPQLSYVFYPYFHAVPPRWIQLMNRGDDIDPWFTAFLQAGYARVLLAVTPAYDGAVLHYLCEGEPWDGGPTPVIGDPLFIPLHEELRRQTDDLKGAVPEGDPWEFTLPTSLVYLEGSSTPLPAIPPP